MCDELVIYIRRRDSFEDLKKTEEIKRKKNKALRIDLQRATLKMGVEKQ